MSNELTKAESNAVSMIKSHDIGELIKPMIRDIHLFDTYVAGTTHLDDSSILERILVGDELTLQREDNPFDQKAILVLNQQKQKLGYIPERDNIIFSRSMDAGKMLKAKITKIDQKNWYTRISIGIYLVDL